MRAGLLVVLWLCAAAGHGAASAADGVLVSNLAPGVQPGDAVNLGQLNQTGAALRDVERVAYSGTAMAVAMTAAYVPALLPGEKTVGLAFGGYRGYTAVSLGFRTLSDDGRTAWGMAVANAGRDWGFNAGIGWKLPRGDSR
ncbi:YadA-like family protein [Variovorax sp. W6]|uniref:YadA-like family protein n=1 Tax=Variovorax sp. W6 TaxID=3093895 RepID=UPI003D806FC1